MHRRFHIQIQATISTITDPLTDFDNDLLASYDYALPPELIAHEPAQPRDHSRLLYAHGNGELSHHRFYELPQLLRDDDVVVFNETRVIKARLRGIRVQGGGAVELLVLGLQEDGSVQALARPAKRLRPGMQLQFADIVAEVVTEGTFRFPPGFDVPAFLERHGEIPLPPYIHAPEHLDTAHAYQPIFAKVAGSVAAPTASLHFTDSVLEAIRARGITMVPLVLTVGLGTFAPVRSERLSEHTMHTEVYDIPEHTVQAVTAAKAAGRRVVAIGTTVMRALEGAAQRNGGLPLAGPGETNIFIKPGFPIRIVDVLLTNFHVPRSTLLVLVSTLAGREIIRNAYEEAIRTRYRFFSFGDAMLLEHAIGESVT